MINNTTKNILKSIERLYQIDFEEHSVKYNSNGTKHFDANHSAEMGHGIEHIKGVLKRCIRISQQTTPEERNIKNFDDLVACTAVLHDIGNLVDRKGHNIYSGAFVRGSLSIGDIETADLCENPKQKGNINSAIQYVTRFYLKSHFTKQDIDKILSGTDEERLNFISQATQEILNENNGYQISSKQIINAISKTLEETSQGKTEFLSDKMLDIIQSIRNKIHDNFSSDEIEMIIDAVEDHNRDYAILPNGDEDKSTPSTMQNVFGKIIFDGDKDDCLETFIIRSYLFAVNELGKKNPEVFFDEFGRPDMRIIVDDIITQMANRFAVTKEVMDKIGITDINLISELPNFAHASCIDPIDTWDFAAKNSDGDVIGTYKGQEVYIKEVANKWFIFSPDDTEPLCELKNDPKTGKPIMPSAMLIKFNEKGGRDIQFKFPLPKDPGMLTDTMDFYIKLSKLCDQTHFLEAKYFITDVIDKTIGIGMTPEEAINYYEGQDSMEDICEKYDNYKIPSKQLRDERYKNVHSVEDFKRQKLPVPPLNLVIDKVYSGDTNRNWYNIEALYKVNPAIIRKILRELVFGNISIRGEMLLRNKEDAKSYLSEYLKENFGESFTKVYRKEIGAELTAFFHNRHNYYTNIFNKSLSAMIHDFKSKCKNTDIEYHTFDTSKYDNDIHNNFKIDSSEMR